MPALPGPADRGKISARFRRKPDRLGGNYPVSRREEAGARTTERVLRGGCRGAARARTNVAKDEVKRMRTLIRIAVVVLCLVPAALAQSGAGTGSIEGSVQGPGGAAIPGASVAVRNAGISQARQVRTDGSGHYIVCNLTPGEYEVTLESTGFATLRRTA
jgi:hypothetical protein